jgi:hypothetical protein
MSKRNKRVFKVRAKQYPSEVRDGITHVYPFPGAKTTNVVEQDRLYFLANPHLTQYRRPYIPGELKGCPIPDGVDLAEIVFVQVIRMGDSHQARIPLTAEQAALP